MTGSYLLIQTWSGRRFPGAPELLCLTLCVRYFLTPRGGACISRQKAAFCHRAWTGGMEARRNGICLIFLVQHTRAPRSFGSRSPSAVASRQGLANLFPQQIRLLQVDSCHGAFRDSQMSQKSSLNQRLPFPKARARGRLWFGPNIFVPSVRTLSRKRSLGCLNEYKFHGFSSGSFSSCCQSPRDAVSCCQVLRLQTFYCSRFKLDFQATAF